MDALAWNVASGLAMTALALVGGVTLLLGEETLRRATLPLAAFAAGALILLLVGVALEH